ncbi:hypothetical protein BDN72DRAFT_642211 [Pluteus cervinus]|uniref:Uncharacterized protein n=1 Tax=Pluteus cervinus TaxID=181527 RepID=A0ACD3AVF8_9AGAR|nr:hypothetical protein BDN72DRAFT_642211 [Pluteus cervinus]
MHRPHSLLIACAGLISLVPFSWHALNPHPFTKIDVDLTDSDSPGWGCASYCNGVWPCDKGWVTEYGMTVSHPNNITITWRYYSWNVDGGGRTS